MGENLSPHEGTELTSTVSISAWVFYYYYYFFFFFNALRTGLYFSKAVGVIRKNTELF